MVSRRLLVPLLVSMRCSKIEPHWPERSAMLAYAAIQLSDTPDASSPTKSMWQTDIISIKVRANAAWAVMPGGAAVITAVNW
jgi:hypothetical protein